MAGGAFYNTAFQAYSMAMMVPAAICTGVAFSAGSYQILLYDR